VSSLLDLLKYECEQLQAEFKKASMQGSGTPQEIADFREGYFKSFIERYFPLPHRVTKGQIVDSFGNKSASIDCLVLNPCHPNTTAVGGKFSIIFADGVDVAIEVKPDISRIDELHRGLKQIQSVKKLRRAETPLLLSGRRDNEIIELSKQIPSFIFALKAKNNLVDTAKEIFEYYQTNSVPENEQVDFIVSLEQGIIYFCKHSDLCFATPKKKGIFIEGWKDLTAAAFLLRANTFFPASATISEPLLQRYLHQITPVTYEILKV
jgi:hypothetical protein